MRSSLRSSFLRTRFGRRMLLLFLACAMLPLTLLTVIVLRQASGQMQRQEQEHLHRTAKSLGMSLVAELNELADAAERVGSAALHSEGRALRPALLEAERLGLRALVLLGESGDTVTGWRVESFVGLTTLQDRKSAKLLFFPASPAGERRLAFTSTHDVDGRAVRAIALLDPSVFFGDPDVQGWRESGMQVCVLLGGSPLWCSVARELWPGLRVDRGTSVTLAGEQYTAATWSGFATITPPGERLDVLVFSETPDALGDSSAFRRSLTLLALVSLVLVFLASHMQLRQSLRPLEDLTRATQRVGVQNLSVQVDVKTNDEFGALARSFNSMSSRIASHVALLSSTAAINEDALRAADVRDLLPGLTAHLRPLLPASYGLSLTVRLEDRQWLRRSAMTGTAAWMDDELELGVAAMSEFSDGQTIAGRFGGHDVRPYMRAPSGHPGWNCKAVAIPLRAERELVGILTILVPHGSLATNAELENVRAIVSELALALTRTRLVGRLAQFNFGTLTALARTVDANSPWTAGHSEAVTHAALRLGKELRLSSDEMDTLHRGGLLHDIGKIAIPGAILDKPGRLTPEEMRIIQSHPEVGARILAPIDAYAPIIPIVLYHHERFNGEGYPRGLRGEAIPALARLVAVVDVYDALVSDRPYRAGWLPERALEHIQQSAGAHLDPVMTRAFAAVESGLRAWYAEQRELGIERRVVVGATQLSAV